MFIQTDLINGHKMKSLKKCTDEFVWLGNIDDVSKYLANMKLSHTDYHC